VVAPNLRQDTLPALRHAVPQVQPTKTRSIAGAGPEMNRAKRDAGAIVFERGVLEAVFGEAYLGRILKSYADDENSVGTHRSLPRVHLVLARFSEPV
jgi:hypothetical protein